MVFCPSCGNRVTENVKFCMKCGCNIEKHKTLELDKEEIPQKEGPVEEPVEEPIERQIEEPVEETPIKTPPPPPAKDPSDKYVISYNYKSLKPLKEHVVIGLIEAQLKKRRYDDLKVLEDDIKKLIKEEDYVIKEKEQAMITRLIKEYGFTGKHKLDDMFEKKVGKTGKRALILSVFGVILVAIFSEILLPMVAEKVTNEPPIAAIEPLGQESFLQGIYIIFKGSADDKEDGSLPGSSLFWSSSIDGDLGTGNSISVSALSVGDHIITLTATDSKGTKTSQTVVVSIKAFTVQHELLMDKTVNVNGKDEKAYIKIFEPYTDKKAPDKGWLVMENPFYKISLNLDHPYYKLYDKVQGKDILVYDDNVLNKIDILTASSLGYGDLDGDNKIEFSSCALDDRDGIKRYSIVYEDKGNGFILLNTEGWDVQSNDPTEGYDVESEVIFGIFADKPYFIDATELNNLQKLGQNKNSIKSPDEIVKDWVLTGEYDSGVITGGDPNHLNRILYEDFYTLQPLTGAGRKPWHAGSAEISKMFPTHVLVGNRVGGGIVFSLPKGKFRFDDRQGIYGAQVATEFLLATGTGNTIAFAVDPVNENAFLYDSKEFVDNPDVLPSMERILKDYKIEYPGKTIDAHNWTTKRFAYVITLTSNWYDASTNTPREQVWEDANDALQSFYNYEDIIYTQLEATRPLSIRGKTL